MESIELLVLSDICTVPLLLFLSVQELADESGYGPFLSDSTREVHSEMFLLQHKLMKANPRNLLWEDEPANNFPHGGQR